MTRDILAEAQKLMADSPEEVRDILAEAQKLAGAEPEEEKTPFEAGQLPGGLMGEAGRIYGEIQQAGLPGVLPSLGKRGEEILQGISGSMGVPIVAGQELQQLLFQIPGVREAFAAAGQAIPTIATGGLVRPQISPESIQPISLQDLGVDPESGQAKVGKMAGDITAFDLAVALGGGAGAKTLLPGMLGRIAPKLGRVAATFGLGTLEAPEDRAAGGLISGGLQAGAETAGPVARAISRTPIVKQIIRAIPAIAGGARKTITDTFDNILDSLKGKTSDLTVEKDLFSQMEKYHDEVRGIDKLGNRLEDKDFKLLPRASMSIGRKFERLENRIEELGEPEPVIDVFGKPLITAAGKKVTVEPDVINNKLILKSINNQLDKEFLPRLKILKRTDKSKKPVKDIVDKLKDYKAIDSRTSKGFKELKLLLNRDLRDVTLQKVPNMTQAISKVRTGLEESLLDTAEESTDKTLQRFHFDANESYKELLAPLEKSDPKRFRRSGPSEFASLRHEKTPEIKQFINKTVRADVKNDTISGIVKLLKLLPKQPDRDMLAFSLLREGKNDPEKFIKIYSKFGKKQKGLLFPKHHKELDRFLQLKKTDPAAFKEPIISAAHAAGIAGGVIPLAGSGLAFATGHPLLGLGALAASPFTASLALKSGPSKKILQKLLEGPAAKVAAKKNVPASTELRGAVISALLDKIRNRQ